MNKSNCEIALIFFFWSQVYSDLLNLNLGFDGCRFEWMCVCIAWILLKFPFWFGLGREMNEWINQSNGILILLRRYFHSQNKWANFTSYKKKSIINEKIKENFYTDRERKREKKTINFEVPLPISGISYIYNFDTFVFVCYLNFCIFFCSCVCLCVSFGF